MEQLLLIILEKIKKTPTLGVFTDMYHICLEAKKTDEKLAKKYLMLLSDECENAIASGAMDNSIKDLFALHKKVVDAGAELSFHLFLIAAEYQSYGFCSARPSSP